MKRKDYQKPSMKVVQLRQRCQILAGSNNGVKGSRSGYENGGAETWGGDEQQGG